MAVTSDSNPAQMLGSARIQNNENRMTLPASLIETGVFLPEDRPENAYWAYDPQEQCPILSNRDELIRSTHKYLGSSSVQSDRSVTITKKLFSDYQGATQLCRPVSEEVQLEYGKTVCFVTEAASLEGEVRFYLVPFSELGYWLNR